MKHLTTVLLTVLFALSAPRASFAADMETDDMVDVETLVTELSAEYGRDRVLVVFDIDNTLLVLDQDIGSDQWFAWQSELLEAGATDHLVADSFQGLLDALNKVYALSPTHPTQADVSDVVRRIQAAGNPVIGLTARNGAGRDATERELRRSGIWFGETGIGRAAGFAGAYYPYDLKYLGLSGISNEEARLWNLGEPRTVTYLNGLMMASGQHKGAMLQALLHKTHREFDAVVFVDDKHKNTDNMEQGFALDDTDALTVRYTREDEKVRRFEESDKAQAIAQWQQLSIGLSIFAK